MASSPPGAPSQRRKRNQAGNPCPDAEVIALSPKTLMAINRFLCEVCNMGFQRDQNLQLHRRRHNLPWKLKQKTNHEVRRKVYICPEIGCVHHDPSRALGDLTGIKKHFSRKHGEKRFQCDKCNKKYVVHCDWKAHNKICGTKVYKYECGIIFSSVLSVHVQGMDLKTNTVLRGNLYLVDLAGNERVDRSEAIGDMLREAQHINKSLSALGDVIFALAQKSPHVPYRNSKLTQVIQSSLGGQAKTLMFVQLNPDVESYSETISTLKFTERVSGVELGAAQSNKEGRGVRELMEQISK